MSELLKNSSFPPLSKLWLPESSKKTLGVLIIMVIMFTQTAVYLGHKNVLCSPLPHIDKEDFPQYFLKILVLRAAICV